MLRFSRATLCIVFVLAMAFGAGGSVAGDAAEGIADLRAAAEQGYADAQSHLGVMYDTGRGVPQDNKEAVKWFRMAAEQGHADAQHVLGFMCESGRGVPQDYVRAHMWFNLAASHGHSSASDKRADVATKMTREQIAEAQGLAQEWKPKTE